MTAGPDDLIVAQICRDIADELPGGHKTAAKLAGVTPSVFSGYCNPGKPECSIPFKRALRLQRGSGRTDFSDLLTAETPTGEGEAPTKLACDALQALSRAMADIQAAYADGTLTPREQQVCLGDVNLLIARASELRDSLAHARVGAVTSLRREDAA